MKRKEVQTRSIDKRFKTRDENGQPVIEGYVALFNTETELWPGVYEEIAPGAFDEAIHDDVRALINHDTTLVLGRNISGTLKQEIDDIGLRVEIKVNPADTDAMNLYERVKRGDVTQCSFGFDILEEDADYRDDGSAKFTLKKVRLFEVSICTFPAYEETGVQARGEQMENHKKRLLQKRKQGLIKKLKGNKLPC